MDKRALIAKAAQERPDQLLLAQVLDKYEQMERRGMPTATGFLSPREQKLAGDLLHAAGIRSGFLFDGGYPDAERKLLLFVPPWAAGDGTPWAEELAFLRADFHGEDSRLSHRDLLGSLMGMGVARERLGDILVSEHSADIISAPSLRSFLLSSWDSAGRVRLTVSEISREGLRLPQRQVKIIRDTVSSLRLDAVTAAAFFLSRGRAAELIAAGRVSLDHLPCEKAGKPVAEGSVLSVRGLGKAMLTEVGGLSRKGRIGITIEKYL